MRGHPSDTFRLVVADDKRLVAVALGEAFPGPPLAHPRPMPTFSAMTSGLSLR